MLDSQYMHQDLRKGRTNTITNHPYGTTNAYPIDQRAQEVTLTPSLLQDTLTIEQSKMASTRTEEVQHPYAKRVNKVAFVSNKLELNREIPGGMNHSAREAEDSTS